MRQGRVLVEGMRSVEAAIEGDAPLERILVTDAAKGEPRIRALIERATCSVESLPAHALSKISDTKTNQGLIAVSRRFVSDSIEKLLGLSRLLVLVGVQDPGNVGTLVRTAAWFGIEGVLADTATADFESPKVVRASMGGVWGVSLFRINEIDEAVGTMREAGFELAGADVHGEPVSTWRPKRRGALVLGSEAHGLSETVGGYLDKRITIEGVASSPAVESLNVSVAGGIVMAHWSGKIDYGLG